MNLADKIYRDSSPEALEALALSPYRAPAPPPAGGVGRLAPVYTGETMALQRPYPEAVQAMVNRAAPTVARLIEDYVPSKSAGQMAEGVRKTASSPVVGRDVNPETIIDRIRDVESSGDYLAKNSYSTASGAYQYIDGTWNNYGGYPSARVAPREVQDRRIQEDLARRVMKYNGDVFKVIAEHYLPRDASRPETWLKPAVVGKTKVDPVASYVRKVIKGTPLEGQFDDYLQQYAR